MAFTGDAGARMPARTGVPIALVVPVMLVGGALIGLVVGDPGPVLRRAAVHRLARGRCSPRAVSPFLVESLVHQGGGPGDPLAPATRSRAASTAGTSRRPASSRSSSWLVGALVLQYTRFGRTIYAIGGNEQSARLMGLPVDPHEAARVRHQRRLRGTRPALVFTAYQGAGLSARTASARSSTRSPRSSSAAPSHRRLRVRGRIDDRRLRLRHDQDDAITFLGAEQSWTRITIGALLLVFVVVQRVIVALSRSKERRR